MMTNRQSLFRALQINVSPVFTAYLTLSNHTARDICHVTGWQRCLLELIGKDWGTKRDPLHSAGSVRCCATEQLYTVSQPLIPEVSLIHTFHFHCPRAKTSNITSNSIHCLGSECYCRKMSRLSPCRHTQHLLWAQILYQLFATHKEEEEEGKRDKRLGEEKKNNNIRTKKQWRRKRLNKRGEKDLETR